MKGEKSSHKKSLHEALTQKKLELLLPSSKQILVNSSIKYNVPSLGEDSNATLKPTVDPAKENCPLPTKTSILRIDEHFSEELETTEQTGLVSSLAAELREKSLKILALSYHHLNVPAAPLGSKGKAVSMRFPQSDPLHLTSLNNILPQPDADPQSPSKQELLARVAKLEQLVHDIISGKVAIQRAKSERKLSESGPDKRESIMEMAKVDRKLKRSATWCKDLGGKLNKSVKCEKSKRKIDNPIAEQREEGEARPPRSFLIKKKGNLKLTDNYKPIREEPDKHKPALKEEPEGRLRLRVNFMPNIINL